LVLDPSQARRMTKTHTALPPLAVLGGNVVGDKHHLRGTADELVFLRTGVRRDQRQHGRTIRWSYAYPALAGWKQHTKNHPEPERVVVESQAPVQVANINVDCLDAEIGAPLRGTVGLLRQDG